MATVFLHKFSRRIALVLTFAMLLSVFAFQTVAFADDKVDITEEFTDEAFRNFVYSKIQKEPGEPIYDTDVANIHEFKISNSSDKPPVESLAGIEYFTSLDDLYFVETPETKGTPVYTQNLNMHYSTLAVTAYSGSETWGRTDVPYDYDGSQSSDTKKVYTHNYSAGTADGNLAWPDGTDPSLLLFIKAVPENSGITGTVNYDPSTTQTNGKGTITFSYTSPGSGDDITNAAELQKDILFSSKEITKSTKDTDNKVLLYHALTGVKFKVRLQENNSDVKIASITSVKLNKIYNSGTCIIKPDYEGYNDFSNGNGNKPKSSAVSKWTLGTTTANFKQAFGAPVTYDKYANTNKFDETFYDGTTAVDNLNNATCSQTFLFIPQDLTDDVTLTIEYKYTVGTSTDQKTATTTIPFGTQLKASSLAKDGVYKWLAGELHTYTLTLGDEVNVSIDDTVIAASKTTDPSKSNLTITNTGTATAYMRVAVIGNWISDLTADEISADKPVAITPCPELADYINGTGKYSSTVRYNTANWILGEDGYYYYKYPVPGGRTIAIGTSASNTHTLFYSLPLAPMYVLRTYETDEAGVVRTGTDGAPIYTGVKPYNRCHLEIAIPVQAVKAGEEGNAWGNVKVKGGSNTVVSQLSKTTQD